MSKDTPEQAKADRTIQAYHYTPDVFRSYFTSPFDQYKERVGQPFTVLRHDTEAEQDQDQDEPEDMYIIRFEDGTEITAWGHEVCVLDYAKCTPTDTID